MKSDVITIDNKGIGIDEAIQETKRAAQYRGLSQKDSLRLQLITEELLNLIRSITGEMSASFWLESEGKDFRLYITTKTLLDLEKREQLIASSTSRKNEAAKSFLGWLRDAFEQAVLSDAAQPDNDLPDEIVNDIYNRYIDNPEWDQYEQSILRRLTDDIKISIRGSLVSMTVSKSFSD